MPWKPALSLFLTTLRLKFLEDSSLDTAVEVGPGKDSDATDGEANAHPSLPSKRPLSSCIPLCFQFPSSALVLLNLGILSALDKTRAPESHWALVTATKSLVHHIDPMACSFPSGARTEVLAQQRDATTHLLQVLDDLEQAHKEFQKRGQGQLVL